MTQTPPAPYPTSTATPAQGAPATPLTVSAGVLATIPPPAAASPSGPVPWTRGWVVILNSSPLTLLVASGGGPVIQIAAFTSDKVYVQTTGTPVTVLPQASATQPVAGSDSTVYATWYHDEPPGAFPAALGSGSAQFAQSVSLLPIQTQINAPDGTAITYLGATGTSIGTFGGMVLTLAITGGGGMAWAQVNWFTEAGVLIGTKYVTAGFATTDNVTVELPHLGPFVNIIVTNNSGGPVSWQVYATSMVQARAGFIIQDQLGPGGGGSMILARTTQVVAAGATTVVIAGGTGRKIYAGPATLYFDMDSLSVWQLDLQVSSNTNVWGSYYTWRQSERWSSNGDTVPVIVPANPLRAVATNRSLRSASITVGLFSDDWRNA